MTHFNMIKTIKALALISLLIPMWVSAGLFDDAEARKAISDLKAKIDAVSAKLDTKADSIGAIETAKQIEELRSDLSKLRGLIESLNKEVINNRQMQQDFYRDLDGRLKKLEPKRVIIDGREIIIEVHEQRAFDTAKALFMSTDYRNAVLAFTNFTSNFPASIHAGEANYWLGNSYFAQRDCKNAIPALQMLQKYFPDHPRTPDAMLNIAACHIELKDKLAGKKILENLISYYPNSEEAQTAKTRLGLLK
jgi:tol-pal system protein YbgF